MEKSKDTDEDCTRRNKQTSLEEEQATLQAQKKVKQIRMKKMTLFGLEVQHKIQPCSLECEICELKFQQVEELLTHLRNKHG